MTSSNKRFNFAVLFARAMNFQRMLTTMQGTEHNSIESKEISADKSKHQDCDQVSCQFLKTSMEKLSKHARFRNKAAVLKRLIDGVSHEMPIIGSPSALKHVINNNINFDIIFKSKKYHVVSD